MAAVTSTSASLRMLVERLNHPIRQTRWRTAREIAVLLQSVEHRGEAAKVYLDWLRARSFESEVATGLTVLLCRGAADALDADDVAAAISRPSALSQMLMRFAFGDDAPDVAWSKCHSGSSPATFEAGRYFHDNKGAQVPPVLDTSITRLERRLRMPLSRQWAFEWHQLMQSSGAEHSRFPYHYVDGSMARNGVLAQVSQRQCDAYRSAFLRTLSCAVDEWGAPEDFMLQVSLDTLPASRGLLDLDPSEKPPWLLEDWQGAANGESLEGAARRVLAQHRKSGRQRLASLRAPVSVATTPFGHVSLRAVLATADFVAPDDGLVKADRSLFWVLPDMVTIEGRVGRGSVDDYIQMGRVGSCMPLCLDLVPFPCGFWHSDYFHVGISIPAPYVCKGAVDIACATNRLSVVSAGRSAGSWSFWHDHWSPQYHSDGMTRVGCVSEIADDELNWAMAKFGMRLAWVVDMQYWTRRTDYGEFDKVERREFFFG